MNNLKTNLSFALIYSKEFFFILLTAALAFIILFDKVSHIITALIIIAAAAFVLFLSLGIKRRKELNEIQKVISNIRTNVYDDASAIKLSRHLPDLQNEIKMMYERSRNDIEYLRKLERMRREFLANVSHELRTPIFAIQGYIETLLDGALNDEKVNRNFLEKANQHTINLNNLLNDLIDISMIESGEMRLSFRYFNVNELLQPAVEEYKTLADEKNIGLIFHQARKGLTVFGDKNRIRQVINNLLQNAIKYTDNGSIEVLVEEEKNSARIIIRDTGIGIPQEDINRVFERFYRVDKARSREVGGTGLGLAIVKHIVEAHGSKIDVKSSVDAGSEFSFSLKK